MYMYICACTFEGMCVIFHVWVYVSVCICVSQGKGRQHYHRGSSGQTEAGTSETHTITLTGAAPPHSPPRPPLSPSPGLGQ